MIDVDAAQARLLASLTSLASEAVPLVAADGRVLACDHAARWQLPVAPTSVMDGYALELATVRGDGPIAIAGTSSAGHPFTAPWIAGTAVRIATGAVVPNGAELVVAQEDVRRRDDGRIELLDDARTHARAGRFVRPAGADFERDAPLLPAGTELAAAELALLGAAGHATIAVHRRPRVAILSNGDELVAVGQTPAPGFVPSTNGMMLASLVRAVGGEVVEAIEVPDDRGALDRALASALARADLVLTSGGASVGDHDLVRDALRRVDGDELLWGVAMRPGKPTGAVRVGAVTCIALPGNPASSLVAFALFAAPVLRVLAGVRGDPRPPAFTAVLGAAVEGEPRREHFVRGCFDGDRVVPLPDQRSGNLRSIARAQLLVRVPAGVATLPAGSACRCLRLPR